MRVYVLRRILPQLCICDPAGVHGGNILAPYSWTLGSYDDRCLENGNSLHVRCRTVYLRPTNGLALHRTNHIVYVYLFLAAG